MREVYIISGYLLSGTERGGFSARQILSIYFQQHDLLYLKDQFFGLTVSSHDGDLVSIVFTVKVVPDKLDYIYNEFLEMLKSSMFFQARLYVEGEDSPLEIIDFVLDPHHIPTIADTISSGKKLEGWQMFRK